MFQIGIKGHCEFCGRRTKQGEICHSCDQRLIQEETEKDLILRQVWANKHKCNRCNTGLTPDRRFNCRICLP